MKTELRETPFDAWQELHGYQESMTRANGQYGATSVFVGTMRDFNNQQSVQSMYLEHYPEMTSSYLDKIALEAQQRWNLLDTFILHRVGDIKPDDTIVVIAVWSAHRNAAFEACRYIIEELKSRAPFWKKETLSDKSERWVTKNSAG